VTSISSIVRICRVPAFRADVRSRAPRRDMMVWQRGETTASPGEIMAFNGITADAMIERAAHLLT